MSRTLATALLVAPLAAAQAPLPAAAQSGTIVVPDRGHVIDGARGTAEELQLTDEETERAFSAVTGLTVGLVPPGPEQTPPDLVVPEVVEALRRTVERRGARVKPCDGGAGPAAAAACVERFVAQNAVAVVLVGEYGDLVDATTGALRSGRTIIVGIGSTRLAPLSVVIASDPLTRAFEQGRAGGGPPGVPRSRRPGQAIVASTTDVGQFNPGADAVILGLHETAPRVAVLAQMGPPAIETADDLAVATTQLPRRGILVGEGVRLTQLSAAGLEGLPDGLRVVAIACPPTLMSLIDQGTRITGCVALASDGAGEAAGNAILGLLNGHDVPAYVDAPLYTYGGKVAAGPGRVQLGRRMSGIHPSASVTDREAAGAALAGRVVGIVGPSVGARREPEASAGRRAAIETGLAELGTTIARCGYGRSRDRAAACVADLVAGGAAAIVVIGGRVDLVAPVAEAIGAGVPVLGMDADYLGDAGAVYLDVDDESVGRLQGRMAGDYAARTWPYRTTHAAILNRGGPQGPDAVADAIERATSLANPNLLVVGRWASSDRSAKAAISAAVLRYRALRLLLGPFSVRGVADLRSQKKPRPRRDLAAFALACSERVRAAIDDGGRVKGCVEVDDERSGGLVVDALARLLAGGSLPSVIEVPLSPYQVEPAPDASDAPDPG